MGLYRKWKLSRLKCSWCGAKIPEKDLKNAITYDTWVGQLYCKRCRSEGAYEGRCPICNNGRRKDIEDREYSEKEIGIMHKKCLEYLINDWKYQVSSYFDATLKNLAQNCSICGLNTFRENAECPHCIERQNWYRDHYKFQE